MKRIETVRTVTAFLGSLPTTMELAANKAIAIAITFTIETKLPTIKPYMTSAKPPRTHAANAALLREERDALLFIFIAHSSPKRNKTI